MFYNTNIYVYVWYTQVQAMGSIEDMDKISIAYMNICPHCLLNLLTYKMEIEVSSPMPWPF